MNFNIDGMDDEINNDNNWCSDDWYNLCGTNVKG